MVVYYTLFGQKVGSHILSIATLSTLFAGSYLATGGKKATKDQGPPIQAKSTDEENFIKEFLAKAEAEEKSNAKH